MPDEAPSSVMIYEIKGQHPTDPGQENYRSLTSPDKTHFYWNKRKFSALEVGDVVFVVNKAGGQVLHTELDATEIPTTYAEAENNTTFSDLGHQYEAAGKWESFVRLKVIQAVEPPPGWSWMTLGSAENTYFLGEKVSAQSAANNIARASQLRDLPDLSQAGKDLLTHCISELHLLAPEVEIPPRPALPQSPDADNASDLLEVLKKYADEQVVFHSTAREAGYSISEYEPGRFRVNRLDANEPVEISAQAYLAKRLSLQEHGGRLPFDGFANPVALKNALIQARSLALTPDKGTVVDVSDPTERLRLFCDHLENLRDGGSMDAPNQYKPAMLACVIEAIGSGELIENKIRFAEIAPKFIAKMKELGKDVGFDTAAQPFFRLTRDMIWLHAVHDTKDLMNDGNVRASTASSKVKYALLKDTFWDLLQIPANRAVALETLKRRWHLHPPLPGFWWVNQGKSYKEARASEFIWAPKKDRSGNTPQHWKNVEKVHSGDIIFNYAKGELRAVSLAISEPFEEEKGVDFGDWEDGGWRVDLRCHDLNPTIKLAEVVSELAALEESGGPIGQSGSVKMGYLFSLSPQAVAIIASKVELEDLPETIRTALSIPTKTTPTPAMLSSAFVDQASAAIRKAGLIYSEHHLRRFACSLLTKPFVILTGTSGTGKTQLALKFAEWLVGNDGYELVPVGADWTDNRQVLGHFSPFEDKYSSTRVLDLILRAIKHPALPFFLILDEMNLSHVERYFADFLSAMESKNRISLHRNGSEVKTAAGLSVPNDIGIPPNLFVIGTVNIDETTYMFSPKVLDRANVIEFSLSSEELSTFLDSPPKSLSSPPRAPESLAATFLSFCSSVQQVHSIPAQALEGLKGTIQNLHSLLEGSGMDFGFRTPSELLHFCQVDRALSDPDHWNWKETCDVQILQKILPKLHGSRRRIEGLLLGLASYCADQDLEKASKFVNDGGSNTQTFTGITSGVFPKSFEKLLEMLKIVRRDQFVSFIQ